MEMSGQLHAVPICQGTGWPPEPVWKTWRGENLPLTEIELRPPRPIYRLRYPGAGTIMHKANTKTEQFYLDFGDKNEVKL
jgi:hypothetical protein